MSGIRTGEWLCISKDLFPEDSMKNNEMLNYTEFQIAQRLV